MALAAESEQRAQRVPAISLRDQRPRKPQIEPVFDKLTDRSPPVTGPPTTSRDQHVGKSITDVDSSASILLQVPHFASELEVCRNFYPTGESICTVCSDRVEKRSAG